MRGAWGCGVEGAMLASLMGRLHDRAPMPRPNAVQAKAKSECG